MLPNFLIIGAMKAASSWLVSSLGQHPDVYLFPGGEIHFFDAYYDRGTDWYGHQFRGWAGQAIIGEKSPQYLSHPEAPARIRATLGPNVRLLAALRHPVDRAYSAYWHGLAHGRYAADVDFATALLRDPQLRDGSMYAAQVQRFHDHFPPERLLLLVFEEITADQSGALRRCHEFLGVDPAVVPTSLGARVNPARDVRLFHRQALKLRKKLRRLPEAVQRPIVAAGRWTMDRIPMHRAYTSLDPALRAELLSDFREDIERLEAIMGRDLSIWYAPIATAADQVGMRSRRGE